MKPCRLATVTLMLGSIFLSTAAEARPDLRQMSCRQAQNLVLQHGAVVFTTGRHTYSMFVSNRSWCDFNQVLFVQYGPTRDNRRCPVAYECREPLFPRGGLFNRWD